MSAVETLLLELDATREQLLMIIELLPDEALVERGTVGDWSVADVLVNLMAWESEMVTAVRQIQQGKRPSRLLTALTEMEAYNQARYEENKERDLNRVFDDFMKVRLELEEGLEAFEDRDLTDTKRHKWLNGRTLADLIKQTTITNERRYLPALQTFAEQWQAREDELNQEGVIPLTTITILNPTNE